METCSQQSAQAHSITPIDRTLGLCQALCMPLLIPHSIFQSFEVTIMITPFFLDEEIKARSWKGQGQGHVGRGRAPTQG